MRIVDHVYMENGAPIRFLRPPTEGAFQSADLLAMAILAAIGLGLALYAYLTLGKRSGHRLRSNGSEHNREGGTLGKEKNRPVQANPIRWKRSGQRSPRTVSAQRPAPSPKDCRWRKGRRRHGASSTRWICTTCQVEAYTYDAAPPKECKRALRPPAL